MISSMNSLPQPTCTSFPVGSPFCLTLMSQWFTVALTVAVNIHVLLCICSLEGAELRDYEDYRWLHLISLEYLGNLLRETGNYVMHSWKLCRVWQFKQQLSKNQNSAQVHKSRSYALTLKMKYRHFLPVHILYSIVLYEMLKVVFFVLFPQHIYFQMHWVEISKSLFYENYGKGYSANMLQSLCSNTHRCW